MHDPDEVSLSHDENLVPNNKNPHDIPFSEFRRRPDPFEVQTPPLDTSA